MTDIADPHVRYLPQISSITRDGSPEPYTLSWQQGSRFLVAKIGDADVTLSPGSHTYVITYTIAGAISPFRSPTGEFTAGEGQDDGTPGSMFVWDVVARGWEMRMAAATITVTLPSAVERAQCAALNGAPGCTVRGAGSPTVVITANDLPPRSGIYLRATMAPAAPAQVSVPWPVSLDPWWGTSLWRLLLIVALAGAAALLGALVGRGSEEEAPGFPVMYAPPEGFGPVQTVYLATESVGGKALTASVLHLAERELVALTPTSGDHWQVTGTGTPEQWAQVDPVSQHVGAALGVTARGSVFQADGSIAAGQVLKSAVGSIGGATTSWSRGAGLTAAAGRERWAQVAVIVSIAIALLLFVQVRPSITGLPFAAFALVGGWYLLRVGVGSRRTPAGRLAWSQSGGFQRLLSTSSAEDRFDYSAHGDLWIAYIPYAVAFDVADAWAAKYRTATGIEPPVTDLVPGLRPQRLRLKPEQLVRQLRQRRAVVDLGLLGLAVVLVLRRWGRRRRRWWGRRRRRRFLVRHDNRPSRPDTRGTS